MTKDKAGEAEQYKRTCYRQIVFVFLDGAGIPKVAEARDGLSFVTVLDRMQPSRSRLLTCKVVVSFPDEVGPSQA